MPISAWPTPAVPDGVGAIVRGAVHGPAPARTRNAMFRLSLVRHQHHARPDGVTSSSGHALQIGNADVSPRCGSDPAPARMVPWLATATAAAKSARPLPTLSTELLSWLTNRSRLPPAVPATVPPPANRHM